MNCSECERDFDRYLDGSLSILVKERLEEHVKSCQKCKLAMVRTNRIRKLLKAFTLPRPSKEISGPVMEALKSQSDKYSPEEATRNIGVTNNHNEVATNI